MKFRSALCLLAVLLSSNSGRADAEDAKETVERLARAPVDEWFYGVGDRRNQWLGNVLPGSPEPPPPAGATAKRNGGYVWAMTSVGENLWFSSLNNGWCGWMMVSGNFFPTSNHNWACETFSSQYPEQANGSDQIPWPEEGMAFQGDWRAPQIYWRNRVSGEIHHAWSEQPKFREITGRSFGFRAAGSHKGVVFMASNPLVQADASVFLLAFDGESGEFIDGVRIPNYVNVRRFRVLSQPGNDEALYLLLGAEMFSSAYPNHLLRWRGTREQPFGREGDRSPTPGFEIVGDLGEAGAGAEFLEHRGRLIVTTWGSHDSPAAMLQSQAIPKGGFTQAEPAVFTKVLDAGDFDPDPVIAYSWLMGAIEEYEGELYWGIILPPGRGIQQLVLEHPTILFDAQNSIVKAHRRTHLFRTNFEDPDAPRTELLYGEEELWAYENGEWIRRPNAMGLSPLFGDAGYGEYFNDYTWTMVNYRGSLYVGTFDTSGAMRAFREDTDCYWACFILRGLAEHEPTQGRTPGFDLYRFDTPDQPPVVVTMDGFGNPANNGVRNAIVMGDELFIGSSTYSNLDTAEGSAGWELFRITHDGQGEASLPENSE